MKKKYFLIIILAIYSFNIVLPQSSEKKVNKLAKKCSKGHIKSCEKLKQIAISDDASRVRKAAIENLTDQSVLTEIAKNDARRAVRIAAINKITDQKVLFDIAKNESNSDVRKIAINKITDQNLLFDIVKNDTRYGVRGEANKRIDDLTVKIIEKTIDQDVLANFAKNNTSQTVRIAAINKITDQNILADIAKNVEYYLDQITVVEKITDIKVLADIAKNNTDPNIQRAARKRRIALNTATIEKITDQSILAEIAKNDDYKSARHTATKKETSRWEKCLKKVQRMRNDVDKIEEYEKFIKKYQDNFYVHEAKKIINKIELQIIAPNDFEKASKENTFESYREFIEKHIEGKLVKMAKILAIDKYLSGKSSSDIIKLFKDNGIVGEYKEFVAGEPVSAGVGRFITLNYDIGIYYGKTSFFGNSYKPKYIIIISNVKNASFSGMYRIAGGIIKTRYKLSDSSKSILSPPYSMFISVVMPDSISLEFSRDRCVKNFPNQSRANLTYIGSAKERRSSYQPDRYRNDFFMRCDPFKILAVSVLNKAPKEQIGNEVIRAFYSIFNGTNY